MENLTTSRKVWASNKSLVILNHILITRHQISPIDVKRWKRGGFYGSKSAEGSEDKSY